MSALCAYPGHDGREVAKKPKKTSWHTWGQKWRASKNPVKGMPKIPQATAGKQAAQQPGMQPTCDPKNVRKRGRPPGGAKTGTRHQIKQEARGEGGARGKGEPAVSASQEANPEGANPQKRKREAGAPRKPAAKRQRGPSAPPLISARRRLRSSIPPPPHPRAPHKPPAGGVSGMPAGMSTAWGGSQKQAVPMPRVKEEPLGRPVGPVQGKADGSGPRSRVGPAPPASASANAPRTKLVSRVRAELAAGVRPAGGASRGAVPGHAPGPVAEARAGIEKRGPGRPRLVAPQSGGLLLEPSVKAEPGAAAVQGGLPGAAAKIQEKRGPGRPRLVAVGPQAVCSGSIPAVKAEPAALESPVGPAPVVQHRPRGWPKGRPRKPQQPGSVTGSVPGSVPGTGLVGLLARE